MTRVAFHNSTFHLYDSLTLHISDLSIHRGYAIIKLLLTGGYSEDGFTPGQPNFVVLNHPFENKFTELYKTGAWLITAEYQRERPEAKTTNYVESLTQLEEMKKKGDVDVLYHKAGYIYESSRSNIFVVKG